MDQPIRDFVFPIIIGKQIDADTVEYRNLKGTGFFIGKRGFGLTASHVIHQCSEDTSLKIFALFAMNNKWCFFPVEIIEHHTTEDVCLIKVQGLNYTQSVISISDRSENFPFDVMTLGYPIYVAQEAAALMLKLSDPKENPDLVCFKGYIRRRISRELGHSVSRGSSFYEIDRALGNGVSGAPVLSYKSAGQPQWVCIGVYVSERGSHAEQLGIVTRTDSFFDWSPQALGKTIKEESFS